MKITYVARAFRDYRVPVLAELDKLCDGHLSYVSSVKWSPERVLRKLSGVLGDRAIYLSGERSLGQDEPTEANTSVCLPFQPGLLGVIGRTTPDVLIGDGFFRWTYAAILKRIVHKTPLVVCYERWSHTERGAQWYRRLYRRIALRFTDAVCCNGRLSADYTQTLGFPANRINTGHMAADTENLAAEVELVSEELIESNRLAWKADGLVFLYVGQLIARKGISQLLDAWSVFEMQHAAGGTLVIVWSGPEEGSLKAQASRLRLQRVRFVGHVDYDGLVPFYAASDVFVMPTLEDNWSLVVPEAMACGMPILCSKYNGCWPELVQEGRNGWIFDPLDRNSGVAVLKLAVQNQGNLRAMGKRSRVISAEHSPADAARSIYAACLLACKRRLHTCAT